MTSRFKISSKHDISTLTIHVLICWNKVTLFGQVVPMCARPAASGSDILKVVVVNKRDIEKGRSQDVEQVKRVARKWGGWG